jgi:peptidoglycan/xylan/chitin deacetylase (PgdA/CDA1 family)
MISIMFHSAGLNNLEWRSAHISDPLDIIRDKLEVIRDQGYRTISMQEATANIGSKRDNLVHLNFDDGYLDNWVHVFPILQEMNQKATVFMTTDFVDPRDVIREQRNISTRDHSPADCCAGFLSYREMREMESSGLVEIQSHALTHTWYFKGPRVVDFWYPGSATKAMGPVWMLWNRFPEKKPFYLLEANDLERKIPYGTPVYEHGKSLETLRFFPHEGQLEDRLIDYVAAKGEEFFLNPAWRSELSGIVDDYRKEFGTKGEYESVADHKARLRHELTESKRLLQEGLGHQVDGLCLPGGGVTENVLKEAQEAGYRHFTLPSKLRNRSDIELTKGMIPRIGNLPIVTVKGRNLGYPSRDDFRCHMRLHNGYSSAKLLFNLNRLKRIFGSG